MTPIILFGGTFDPVHAGHVAMAVAAMREIAADNLRVLPAGNPYQRHNMPFAAAAQRTHMLALAFAGDARVHVDGRELHRSGPTYTADTLKELRDELGDRTPLVWLIGGDAFARLDTWHRWRSLHELANFAVVPREGLPHPLDAASDELKAHLAGRMTGAGTLGKFFAGRYALLESVVPAISSTDVRARLARRDTIRGLVPDAVCDYIEQHKLYRSEEKIQVGH